MSTLHWQFDTCVGGVYGGAVLRRWGLGLLGCHGEDGSVSVALMFGPFYVGLTFG